MNFLTFTFANSNILTGISIFFAFLFSCDPVPKRHSTLIHKEPIQHQSFALVQPENDLVTYLNEEIHFEIKPLQINAFPDSIQVYLDGNKNFTSRGAGLSFTPTSIFEKTGRQNIRLKIFFNDSLNQVLTTRITVLADKNPSELKYKVIRTLPHDPTAYVQGLIYYKSLLYEGSGQYAKSKLKKINPKNGETIFEIKLDDEFFGEGITLFNNKIYQLTYQSRVGFVYDAESFELIRKFDLQTVEGWGLTHDSKNIISSDGSSVLYFYDPEYLTQVGQLDVCDHTGLVDSLNELEYIDGYIWANIYGQKNIVKIDVRSGKIVGKLNLENLFPKNVPDDMDHVLNGIAFNPETNTYYITGKLWPLMYEIEIFD
jgi:glutamine cyclotransferase